MVVEIISWSISTKVWDKARMELATPGLVVWDKALHAVMFVDKLVYAFLAI